MTHRYLLAALLSLVTLSTSAAVDPSELKPGLIATFTEPEAGAAITRLEPAVAFTVNASESPHPRLTSAARVEWKGFINVVRAGKYAFAAVVEGGTLRVKINGVIVLPAGADPKRARIDGPDVNLQGGVQPFEAVFTSAAGDAHVHRAELLWKGPGFREEPVPHPFFGHLPQERPAGFAKDAAAEHGRFRFEELACIRCHKPAADDKMAAGLAERPGPVLTDIAKRAYPGWLDAWLTDPKKLRPHTTMPKVFTDDAAGRAERFAVVKYLASLGAPLDRDQPPTFSKDYAKSLANGRVLFGVTGCAACHQQPPEAKKAARNDLDDEKLPLEPDDYVYGAGTTVGPAAKYLLGAVGSKTRPEVLAAFLKDPLKTHPAGRMPNLGLESKDALDLARFLCQTTDDGFSARMPATPDTKPAAVFIAAGAKAADLASFDRLPADTQWAEAGRRLLVTKGCVNCHDVGAGGKKIVPAAEFPTLADIRKAGNKGCLIPGSSTAPDYKLDGRETTAVAAFLKDGLTGAGSPSPIHSARLALKRFNCLNCHQRDGEGGLSVELAEQMKMLEKADNNDDIRPPVLTGVGHKSRTSWLKGVLTQALRARPWMAMRMPQYGEANVGRLPTALAALEGTVPDDVVHKVALSQDKIAAGRTIVGKSGMGCISCHDISDIPNTGTRGPDLATINQRVRYEWYERWLSQPLRMSPGTRMPQAFIDGKSPLTGVLHGEGEAQAEAMWAYLSLGPGLPLPEGMEPPKGLTVAVKERPELLRTFLKEGGNRAIAVGYPGGVSLAFSADESRMAYAWAGNFLDATPVWDKRGGKPALLLGPKFWTAPAGHPWGVTSVGENPPDFAARATDPAFGVPLPVEPPKIYAGPRHTQFDGYDFDKYGNPTFRYRLFGEANSALRIAETPAPLKGSVATGLRRSFVIEEPPGRQVWFQAGATAKEPRLLNAEGSPLPFDGKATAPTVSAVGVKVILPADGERVTVLEVAAAPEGTAWRFVPKPGGGWLAVLKLPAGKEPFKGTLVLNTWALPKDDESLYKGLANK